VGFNLNNKLQKIMQGLGKSSIGGGMEVFLGTGPQRYNLTNFMPIGLMAGRGEKRQRAPKVDGQLPSQQDAGGGKNLLGGRKKKEGEANTSIPV